LTTYSGSAPLDNVQLKKEGGYTPPIYNCPFLKTVCLKKACMLYDDEIESCAIYSIHKSLEQMADMIYVRTS
jgi:hypothetical protein